MKCPILPLLRALCMLPLALASIFIPSYHYSVALTMVPKTFCHAVLLLLTPVRALDPDYPPSSCTMYVVNCRTSDWR
ncbi:hypothetical protein BV25DRAFT_1466611 [Artomyces pyxidatus]|uniref:Uncharacterized protein n=1 Tax=Artomyces pyxidatus TaxID=48021 RepID=A0ACB8SMP1_9AGAM|nr:hypothetical protein BV25DRAFT_1466611 [Artomyces pyxidatus]